MAFARWERLPRRALARTLPGSARAGLDLLLLAAVSWALVRDVAYLRTIPIDDVFGYDCYARAFWRGPAAVVDEPRLHLCGNWAFAFWVAPPHTFHTFRASIQPRR
jgi:hypothetical protein